MHLVRNILEAKTGSPVSVSDETPVIEALRLMSEKNICSVIVLKKDDYRGIFTERDYSRKVVLAGKNSSATKVADIMSVGLPELDPNDSVERCMELMNDKNIRYLPVFENSKFVGIVSISDVIRQLMMIQQETIQHLENYIHQ